MTGQTKHCNVTQEYYNLWNNTVIKNITSGSGISSSDLGTTVPAYQNCTVTSNINRTESSCPKLVETECSGGKINNTGGTQQLTLVPTFNSTELCECTGDFPTSSGNDQSVLCTCINNPKKNGTNGFTKTLYGDYIITKNCTAKFDSSQLSMNCVTKPCISDLHLQVFNISIPQIKACNDSTSGQQFYPNITDLTTASPVTTTAAGTSKTTQGTTKGSSPPQTSTSSSGTTPKPTGSSSPKTGSSAATTTAAATAKSSGSPATTTGSRTSTGTAGRRSTSGSGTPTPKTTSTSNATSGTSTSGTTVSGTSASSNFTSPRTGNASTGGNVTEEEGSGTTPDITQLLNASSTVKALLTSSSTPESAAAESVELLKQVGSSPSLDFQRGGASSLNPLGGASILPLLLFFYYIFMFAGITKKAQRKTKLPLEEEEE